MSGTQRLGIIREIQLMRQRPSAQLIGMGSSFGLAAAVAKAISQLSGGATSERWWGTCKICHMEDRSPIWATDGRLSRHNIDGVVHEQ